MKSNTVSTYEHWGTMRGSILAGISTGFPAHKLAKNQFPLSKEEFDFLAPNLKSKYTIEQMIGLLEGIQSRMKRMK